MTRAIKGQALVEFAIMGSLALLALAFMIQIGLRQNYQQEIQQQTFRQALSAKPGVESDDDFERQAIQVQHFRDRQIPNPSQGFAVMSRTPTQGSAAVTWGDKLTYLSDDSDSRPKIIVRLNNSQTDIISDEGVIPEGQPLIKRIDKTLNSQGKISQISNTSSSTATSTEQTTMTLSTGGTLSSSLTSDCQFQGDVWRCGQ